MQEFQLIAKTFQGLEEVLAQELTELGFNEVQMGKRMVSFVGDKEAMYRANFCLRTAVRVLKPFHTFSARTPDEVYDAVKTLDWNQYIQPGQTFSIDATVYSSEFRNSRFVTYRVKDAIVDYFMEQQGRRPNISLTNPDIRINIHIAERDCTLSLDSSGESLHLRGYRVASVEAPINEVMAAALVKLSGWKADCDLIDPFCGSGTIAVEAALIARNIYPGVFRKKFGFENWPDFDPDLLSRIYEDDSQEREFSHHIYAYDLNRNAVIGAEENAKSAGVADCITCKQMNGQIGIYQPPAVPSIPVFGCCKTDAQTLRLAGCLAPSATDTILKLMHIHPQAQNLSKPLALDIAITSEGDDVRVQFKTQKSSPIQMTYACVIKPDGKLESKDLTLSKK